MADGPYAVVDSTSDSVTLELSSMKVTLSSAQQDEIRKCGWGSAPEDNCFAYAKDGAEKAALLNDNAAVLMDMNCGIGGVWKGFPAVPEDQADIDVDSGKSANMKDYIRKCLDEKYPVLAGVNSGHASTENDGVTDHFLVVIGYETEDGTIRKFHALDNASSTVPQITFEVDDDSKMSKPVLTGKARTGVPYIDENIYVITQLRVWKKIKPTSRRGVWGRW